MSDSKDFDRVPASRNKMIVQISSIFLTMVLLIVTGMNQFSCYPMITNGELPKFCYSQNVELDIIRSPKTHGSTLSLLASKPELGEAVIRALATSLDSPRVANNPREIERNLAFNPNIPTDVLGSFVKSEDPGVLIKIANRTNVTPEILRDISNNSHVDLEQLQLALVKNPEVPEDVLNKLAKTTNKSSVLFAIAALTYPPKNANDPPVFRASASILQEVMRNPLVNDSKNRDQYLENLPIQLANNFNTPEDVLLSLSTSQKPSVLRSIIQHPSHYKSVLEKIEINSTIWKESNLSLQRLVAAQDSISSNLAQKLSEINDRIVLSSLYDNPSISPDLKEIIGKKLNINPNSEELLPPDPDPVVIKIPETRETTVCPEKHIRNNFIGGAAAALGFFFGGPIGALAAYGAVTGTMEAATTFSDCGL